jgi:Glycosyl transferase family 2
MIRRHIPQPVLDAAHARSAARAARDWTEADRLRAEIEAAGWKVVDRGTDFALGPKAPPDLVDGDRVRYGSSSSVPSRFAEPSTDFATVVLIATDRPDDLERTLAGLRPSLPAATSMVIVADGPSDDQADALERMRVDYATEIVWTSERLGDAAATNIGLRRTTGAVIVLIEAGADVTGDVVTKLSRALDDPNVAIAGAWGVLSDDLRAFRAGAPGDVDAIEGDCQAFRRSDAVDRGPLDERFRSRRHLDIWWSLVLRDEGPGQPPRRAVHLGDLPVARSDAQPPPSEPAGPPDRSTKRDLYRVIDRFGSRRDLLTGG